MTIWMWIGIIVVLAVIAAGVWFLAVVRRKSQHLQQRFGPEYDRALRDQGDRRRAERELTRREERVEQLQIRPLPSERRVFFADQWRRCQALFVDDPRSATGQADRLVSDVMRERGYPVADFEQRAEDLSVRHPVVVEHYRAAHAIAQRQERGQASTEDLRRALIHYRALFEDLLQVPVHETTEVHR